MTLTRRTPLRRKRAKPRRVAARCSVRGCRRPPKVETGRDDFLNGERLCLTHAKREADRLWAAPARDARDVGSPCELVGTDGVECGGAIQAAHGFPRKYLGTRWLALNRWLICSGHHRYYTDRWPEWVATMRSQLGDVVYDELDRLRRDFVGPVDYAAIIAELRGRDALEEIEK